MKALDVKDSAFDVACPYMIAMLGGAFFLLVTFGCAAPQRMGITRVQVCINAETAQRYEGPPRTSKGASVCADFEGGQ